MIRETHRIHKRVLDLIVGAAGGAAPLRPSNDAGTEGGAAPLDRVTSAITTSSMKQSWRPWCWTPELHMGSYTLYRGSS
jgi:hypothetical protein